MKQNTEKWALVTGVSKGIGAAIAKRLAREGLNIFGIYRTDKTGATQVKKAIQAYGRKVELFQVDITDDTQLDKVFNHIKNTTPTLHVLVNNVGIYDEREAPFAIEVFEHNFQVNFLAQIKVTKRAVPLMPKGSSIVFISSIAGFIGSGTPETIAYSAMKAALNSYMKNLARILAPKIRVNAVAPGRTLTPMWGDLDKAEKRYWIKDVPLKKWVTPEEVADAVWFLIENTAVCGEILTVDAGLMLKGEY